MAIKDSEYEWHHEGYAALAPKAGAPCPLGLNPRPAGRLITHRLRHVGRIAADARKNGTAVIAMYALRPLRNQADIISCLRGSGTNLAELAALLKAHGVGSPQEAAMRFCRHHSGADVVLTGTGDVAHLEANISAAAAAPLPAPLAAELRRIFPGPAFGR